MLKRNLLRFIVILFGIIAIYFLKDNFSEYNLRKSISACVVGQKRTAEALGEKQKVVLMFDIEKVKKFCEKEIRKQKQD